MAKIMARESGHMERFTGRVGRVQKVACVSTHMNHLSAFEIIMASAGSVATLLVFVGLMNNVTRTFAMTNVVFVAVLAVTTENANERKDGPLHTLRSRIYRCRT